jgi:hypothetical protein
MIAEATENAAIGAQTGQLAKTVIQRILRSGDEIASDQSEMGTRLIGHIHGSSKLAFVEKRTEMNVGQLRDSQTIEFLRQIGKLEILLPQ